MTIKDLNEKYIKLHNEYGDDSLDAIINGGCSNNPDICFVFMNPTGRNVGANKSWKGLKAPWLGTKVIFKLFYKINIIDETIFNEIQSKKPKDWTEEFADRVYKQISDNKIFITNLGKCTQIDARALPDRIFKEYLDLLYEELIILNPKKIILFGNQVSSIVLNEKISVSNMRKKKVIKNIKGHDFEFYSVHYPVGNAIYNMDISAEDINYIKEN